MTDQPTRVSATDAAKSFIAEIRADHPEILFHQSGGCCDGLSPMCYPADDFKVGEVLPGQSLKGERDSFGVVIDGEQDGGLR